MRFRSRRGEDRTATDAGGSERPDGAADRRGWTDRFGADRAGEDGEADSGRAATPPPLTRAGGGALGQAARFARRGLDALVDRILRFFLGFAFLCAGGAVWLGLVVGVATWEKAQQLPDSAGLMDGRQRGSVTVLDQSGEKLGVRGQRFERITAADAARPLIDAILSTEDRRFYWHLGLDPIGLARAIWTNYRLGYTAQGGSTITQQVAKLAFLSHDRTFSRKLEEVPLALALEFSFSKDEILSIYLNRAYLGAASFGFEAASRRYFGKSAKEVTPAQAALLAGLLRAPSKWSPDTDFAAAQQRAEVVLGAMRDAGALSDQEHLEARAEVASMTPRKPSEYAPHFVDWIADEQVVAHLDALARDHLGGEPSDIDVVVSTTLDRNAQSFAEKAINDAFEKHEKTKRNQDAEAAAVILTPDGAVRAMVGGRTYGDSVFNRATQAKRQVGSAFKPVVFATAIERGLRPNASVKDAPVRIGRWRPKNYSGRYRGWITLEQALSVSSNTAAVRLMSRVGPGRVARMAERFGYPKVDPAYPSIALGAIEASPLEVAGAYAVFARRGLETRPFAVKEIRTPDGRLLWERPEEEEHQAIRVSTSGWVTSMMRSVVERGTGRRARLPDFRPAAGKTGTTQSARDVWFAGFTADYVGVFWVGKDDNKALRGKVVGGNLPAEIWREAMAPLHQGKALAALPQRRIPGGSSFASIEELEAAAAARAEAEAAALAEGKSADAAKAAGAVAANKASPTLRSLRSFTPGRPQKKATRYVKKAAPKPKYAKPKSYWPSQKKPRRSIRKERMYQ